MTRAKSPPTYVARDDFAQEVFIANLSSSWFLCLISGAVEADRPVYYDDYEYYYYEDDSSSSSNNNRDNDQNYDLTELVKAWKEYIKEKAEKPKLKEIVEYECPPRDESYRIPDETQCDK